MEPSGPVQACNGIALLIPHIWGGLSSAKLTIVFNVIFLNLENFNITF
jgi:hypothetical protein